MDVLVLKRGKVLKFVVNYDLQFEQMKFDVVHYLVKVLSTAPVI